MHKIIATVPTRNKTISKGVTVTFAAGLVYCACLWVGVTRMGNEAISLSPSPAQVSVADVNSNQGKSHDDQFGQEDQIVITHADSAGVSREAVAFQEFKREIASSTRDLDNSDAAVTGIVERLTSLRTSLPLTYIMTKSFFNGSSRVDGIFFAEAGYVDHVTSGSVGKATQAIERPSYLFLHTK